MTTLTEQAARWALTLRFQDIPEDVLEQTKLRVLDTFGAMLAASVIDFGRAIREAGLEMSLGGGHAHIVGFGDRVTPMVAALVNGGMAQAFQFDDVHNETMIEVSAPVVAAALAVGEQARASGADVLAAIVVGSELTCRIGTVAPLAFHRNGLHPTGIIGALGATFAACRLMQLDTERTRHALGIAGGMGAGINESWSDGSWGQLLGAGWAAHSGVSAAILARNGFTGPASVLEGRHGLFRAHVHDPDYPFDFDRMLAKLGKDWESRYISLKPYPCSALIHPYIEAVLHLREHEGLTAANLKRLTCPVAEYAVPLICEPAHEKVQPASYSQARISLPYALAEALHVGKIDFRAFNQRNIQNPQIQQLAQKVSYVVDPDAPGSWQYKGWVVAELADGRSLERIEEYNRGSAENPMNVQDLALKFQENAALALPSKVDAIIDAVIAFEQFDSIDDIVQHIVREDTVAKIIPGI